MTFSVKDSSLLEGLGVDKKVEFEFVQEGNTSILTSVK